MDKNVRCFNCESINVKTIGFSDFGSNNIEIEELNCLDCGFKTRYPLQNRIKQLRENIQELGNGLRNKHE